MFQAPSNAFLLRFELCGAAPSHPEAPGPSSAPTGLRVAVQSLALASCVLSRGRAAPCPRVRGGRCPQGLAVGPAVCVCVAAVSGVTSAVYGVARSAASAAVLHALCFHSLKVGASSWGLR